MKRSEVYHVSFSYPPPTLSMTQYERYLRISDQSNKINNQSRVKDAGSDVCYYNIGGMPRINICLPWGPNLKQIDFTDLLNNIILSGPEAIRGSEPTCWDLFKPLSSDHLYMDLM